MVAIPSTRSNHMAPMISRKILVGITLVFGVFLCLNMLRSDGGLPFLDEQTMEIAPQKKIKEPATEIKILTKKTTKEPTTSIKEERFLETVFGPKSYKELENLIFRPLGYKLKESSVIPVLDFMEKPNCPKVFSDWLKLSESYNESATPPREIPQKLLDNYTFNGHVHLIKGYMDDRSGTQKALWNKKVIEGEMATDPMEVTHTYGGDEAGIYNAMKAYNVSGMRGVVIGSLTPWLEAYALKLGAKHVTTMEYMHIDIPDDDRIDWQHPVKVAKESDKHIGKYDFVASFSSLEHSGLGRYGDVLDPIGDLREAMKIHCLLKEKGFLFVSIPMGWDTLYWNRHRIYGRLRLSLFAAGFDVLDIFSRNGKETITEDRFQKNPKSLDYYFQWVLVLRKR